MGGSIGTWYLYVLSRQSLTRKERAEVERRLLGMINMMWGRGFQRKLSGGRVWDALEKG